MSLETSKGHEDGSSKRRWFSLLMKKCWSWRSSRENNAGLACGHEQVKRVESADAAQRRGTVQCPRYRIEESARQVDWRVLSALRSVR